MRPGPSNTDAGRTRALVAIATTVVATGTILLGARGWLGERDRPPVREIVLEARDVSFGPGEPRFEIRPGERVRLVVRNTDPGVAHAIAVPALGVDTIEVPPRAERRVEITAPHEGTVEFVCPYHLPRMRGSLVVRPEAAPGR